jgi:light-regulated signal transduction histidine kinase (bacteriophytochrome)
VLDLSELKQTQAMLTAYAEKLKRSNEELENFAFMASHDLQEPVRKVQSNWADACALSWMDRFQKKLKGTWTGCRTRPGGCRR